MKSKLNELKRTVFYEILNIVGRVFVVARYSGHAIIGRRGFTKDEMNNGIVLVFNKNMNFTWDESGISASLVFDTAAEKCFVPVDDVVVIYSPELNSQFIATPQPPEKAEAKEPAQPKGDSTVVKVDFTKRKR